MNTIICSDPCVIYKARLVGRNKEATRGAVFGDCQYYPTESQSDDSQVLLAILCAHYSALHADQVYATLQ